MRRAEFDRLVHGEFGDAFDSWILDMHVLEQYGKTASELIEHGGDEGAGLSEIWMALCHDFDVPFHRRLGDDV